MKLIKIKLCKSLHLSYLLYYSILVFIIFQVLNVFSKSIYEVLYGNLAMLGFIFIAVLIYIAVRCFYNSYILINDNELLRFKGKKIIYKINLSDIVELGFRKMSPKMWFLLPLSVDLGDPLTNILSIRFKQGKTESEIIFDNLYKIVTLTQLERDKGLKEYCECLFYCTP